MQNNRMRHQAGFQPSKRRAEPLRPVHISGSPSPSATRPAGAPPRMDDVLPGQTPVQPIPQRYQTPVPSPTQASRQANMSPVRPGQATQRPPEPSKSVSGNDDRPIVSIKLTVPQVDHKTLSRVFCWRPTVKQVLIAIGIMFVFTVGYQMGRSSMRASLQQQQTRAPHSLSRIA